MKNSSFVLFPMLPLLVCFNLPAPAQSGGLYDAVDPMIGTSNGGMTFPGASLPFGMMQWSPETNPATGYYIFEDKKINGFSLTHLSGVGCSIFADVPILPWTGPFDVSPGKDPGAYAVTFDHSTEEAHPGYYTVTLGNGVRAELTVDERSGIARFHFPEGQPARLLVNASDSYIYGGGPLLPGGGREKDGSQLELTGSNTLRGTVTAGGFCGSPTHYTLYFAAIFEQPFVQFATWQQDAIRSGERTATGKHTGAWLDFGKRREIQMKVGLSYVSKANALANLNKEISGWNFDAQREKARKIWTELLNKVEIEGGTPDQRKIFATAIYHSLLDPTLFSDENGEYIGFDWKTHSLAGSKQKAQYANYSDWDIYRNTVQFQALLDADRESDMMQSLVNDAEQSGRLPGWPVANESPHPMSGDSVPILLSSSYAFGAHNFDTATALKYMVKGGSEPEADVPFGIIYDEPGERAYLKEYLQYGYIPADDPISASRTLEYANDDFAISQFARALGDTPDYRHFLKQSENWRNLLDPETRWIRPRHANGSWLAGFDAERTLPRQKIPGWPSADQFGFQEGNSAQYTFMVPFDYQELFRRIGSESEVQARLDKFFVKVVCPGGEACFTIANEPDFVAPYAYTFAGMPWKTQEVNARIEKETFTTGPGGIPGNDDLGATSGVYLWDALGFYPAVPGVGGLVLGAPMFHRATLHLAGGRVLTVRGEGNGPYVESVTLNGAAYSSSWLPLSALKEGTSELVFTLSTQPNRERGTAQQDRPPSFTQ